MGSALSAKRRGLETYLIGCSGIPDERVEGIWRQVLDVFRGGLLADWYVVLITVGIYWAYDRCFYSAVAESFPLHVQEAEEKFDLSLIATLEIDVVLHLGEMRVPDYLIVWYPIFEAIIHFIDPFFAGSIG